jgi:uncharacterized membrane protein
MIAGFTRFSRFRQSGYTLLVIVGVLRIPAHADFRLYAPVCDLGVSLGNAWLSLQKVPHFVLFGIFFLFTAWQFDRVNRRAFAWSLFATLALGVLIELEEGATRTGNCRLADLLPDLGGALIAMALLLVVVAIRQRVVHRIPSA